MDPTARFSGRADAYAAARPGYPAELAARLGVVSGVVVADLGSGTGIAAKVFLDAGATVFAVEPNAEMRAQAVAELGAKSGFRSVAGRAEATTLEPASVDLVTAAQAFHWFDVAAARAESARILRPGGRVALIWNDRDLATTPFLRAYEAALAAHCPGYLGLQGKADTPEKFDAFFGRGRWTREVIPNAQHLDRERLSLRVASSSYAPASGSEAHAALERELDAAFDAYAESGVVTITYACVVIAGTIS